MTQRPLLLHADNFAILSIRPEDLQRMKHPLQELSKKKRLSVKLERTDVLAFEPHSTLEGSADLRGALEL